MTTVLVIILYAFPVHKSGLCSNNLQAAAGLGLAWNDKNDQGQNEDKDEEEEEVGESSSGHQNNRTGTGARRSEVLETHIRSLDINSNKTPMSRTLQRENPAHNTYLSNFNEGERDLPTAFANIDEDQQDLLVTFPDTIFKRSGMPFSLLTLIFHDHR